MITFVTTESLQELANSDTFFCDGTFYTCPSFFYQIYSLHIKIDDIMTPVVYAFLPGKSQAVYTRFFSLLQDKMTDLGLDFAPTSAVLDFEVAVHNSLKNLFSRNQHKGLLLSLYPMHMEKSPIHRSTKSLSRQRRRQDPSPESSNFATDSFRLH